MPCSESLNGTSNTMNHVRIPAIHALTTNRLLEYIDDVAVLHVQLPIRLLNRNSQSVDEERTHRLGGTFIFHPFSVKEEPYIILRQISVDVQVRILCLLQRSCSADLEGYPRMAVIFESDVQAGAGI